MNLKKTSVFIHEERKKLNLSQKELGKRLYVTDKAVSKWERGLAFPDVDTLKSLAVLFHFTVQNIIDCDLRSTGEADNVRISQVKKLWTKTEGSLPDLPAVLMAGMAQILMRSGWKKLSDLVFSRKALPDVIESYRQSGICEGKRHELS